MALPRLTWDHSQPPAPSVRPHPHLRGLGSPVCGCLHLEAAPWQVPHLPYAEPRNKFEGGMGILYHKSHGRGTWWGAIGTSRTTFPEKASLPDTA